MIEWMKGLLKRALFQKQVSPRWRLLRHARLLGMIEACEMLLAEAEKQKDASWEGKNATYWGPRATIAEGQVSTLTKQLATVREERKRFAEALEQIAHPETLVGREPQVVAEETLRPCLPVDASQTSLQLKGVSP